MLHMHACGSALLTALRLTLNAGDAIEQRAPCFGAREQSAEGPGAHCKRMRYWLLCAAALTLMQIMAHATSSSSNSEERVQQLLQLQLVQRQEVATVSSALQAANIRVQTLETQLRTAQVLRLPILHSRVLSSTLMVSFVCRVCRPCRTRLWRASKTCSSFAMNLPPPSDAQTTLSLCC